ncbi:betaine aldehyde dehydrogenase [Nannochloropsis oceanica]
MAYPNLADLHALQLKLYIGGQFMEAPLTMPVIDPASEELIVNAPAATESHVNQAVEAARGAFPYWSSLSGADRAKYLDAIAQAVKRHKPELAELESRDNGKPLPEAMWDLDDVSGTFTYYAGLARELDGKQYEPVTDLPPGVDYTASLRYEAVGVVAAIVPWNYPLLMATWKLAPALAAGCTVVLKPSEVTPLTALAFAKVLEQVGMPAGVVNIVTGGPDIGSILSNHDAIDKITFTGSVPTGIKIMTAAAKGIKNITLELGGKSPAIVFDSCDLVRTVEWVMFGCFWTNGQICSATSRLLIQDKIYEQFIEKLVEETNKVKVGNPLGEGVRMGPLVNKSQYEKVLGFVSRAKAEGATVVAGRERPIDCPRGYFMRPTILTGVTTSSEVWCNEIFGPVLSVLPFSTEEEAIRLANDTEFGLAGAVFSGDVAQLNRVTEQLRVGCVWRNCSQPCFSQLPWGGMKRSGLGRDLGREGLKSYLETKQIVTHVTANPLGWYNIAKL